MFFSFSSSVKGQTQTTPLTMWIYVKKNERVPNAIATWFLLEIINDLPINDLPIGFPINNIISHDFSKSDDENNHHHHINWPDRPHDLDGGEQSNMSLPQMCVCGRCKLHSENAHRLLCACVSPARQSAHSETVRAQWLFAHIVRELWRH